MVDDCLTLLTADDPVVFVRLASSHGSWMAVTTGSMNVFLNSNPEPESQLS